MKRYLIIIILLSLASGASAADFGNLAVSVENLKRMDNSLDIQPVPVLYPPDRYSPPDDISTEYSAAFSVSDPGQSEALFRKLRGYRILFVPGFLSNLTVNPGFVEGSAESSGGGDYFNAQIAWLRAGGVDAWIVDIESEEGSQFNAKRITQSVISSPKPVIIVAHSKGGVDTLEALLSDNQTDGKVAGVITIQSPLLGTPVADFVLENGFLSTLLRRALITLGGSDRSLRDLSVKRRRSYFQDNSAAISGLTARTPFICFGSWVGSGGFTLGATHDYLQGLGMDNDGLVPARNTALPGSWTIAVGGLDHQITVKDNASSGFDRIRFLKTLLGLLDARISGIPRPVLAPAAEM